MDIYEYVFVVMQENVPTICQRNLSVVYQDKYIWIYIPNGAKFISANFENEKAYQRKLKHVSEIWASLVQQESYAYTFVVPLSE